MNKIYTGIGSRETPSRILRLMNDTSAFLNKRGYKLRSGGAIGADTAFETFSTNKDSYIPKLKASKPYGIVPHLPDFVDIAKICCPHLHKITDEYARNCHIRNICQIIGHDVNNPIYSDFVLAYTVNGGLNGGTATALRCADLYHVPVFNYGSFETLSDIEIMTELKHFLIKQGVK